MGGCLSSPKGHNVYSSAHSSVNGGDAGGNNNYNGYSAYVRPATPDFGISSAYEVLRLLGEGGTGQTWLCKELATGDQYAIKFVRRPIPRVVLPMLLHEIQIQARLGEGHINLVKAREVLLSHQYLGIVMQYAAGGNLTQYVSDRWSTTDKRNGLFIDEDEARFLFQQVLSAMEYLHQHHVAHRDLKLDNIVLTDNMPPRIKLCDFGFAKDWDATSNMQTVIGTPVYMAPELIGSKRHSGGYDAPKAEMWACGVLLFVMLLGMFPFDHIENPDPNSSQAQVEVWMEQRRGNWRDNARVGQAVKRLSPDCLDLLEKIFVLEESQRISVAGIRAHPWMRTPLSSRFQRALDGVLADQQRLQHNNQAYQTPERSPELEALLARSGQVASPGDPAVERYELAKRPHTLPPSLSTVVEASDSTVPHPPPVAEGSLSPRMNELFAAAAPTTPPLAPPAPGHGGGGVANGAGAASAASCVAAAGHAAKQHTSGGASSSSIYACDDGDDSDRQDMRSSYNSAHASAVKNQSNHTSAAYGGAAAANGPASVAPSKQQLPKSTSLYAMSATES